MALCRCFEIHRWPEEGAEEYVAYVLPVGYPETAIVCGLCDKPGVIWLTGAERSDYEKGRRIFEGPERFARIKAGDGELQEGRVVGCLS